MSDPAGQTASEPPRHQPTGVVHLTRDLMLTSRVGQFCRSRQIGYQVVRNFDAIGASDVPIGTLVVDLQAPGWSAEAYKVFRSGGRPVARVVAYAQHVESALLATAAELNIATVLTRGQFDARFAQLLGE